MTERTETSPATGDHAAEWHREAAYHLARAVQERRLAAHSTVPEAEAVHAILANTHLARAQTAQAAAMTPDTAPVHDDRMKAVRAVIQESFGLPAEPLRGGASAD